MIKDTIRRDTEILFYRANGRFGFLSNFSLHPITINGRTWRTVEHYFQGQKFVGTVQEEAIYKALTPGSAKKMGNDRCSPSGPLRKDWYKVRENVMYEAIYAKFTQHENLRELLLATGDAYLIENSKRGDIFWGDGGNGKGKNRMGVLLMRLRSQLREKTPDVENIKVNTDSKIVENQELQPDLSDGDDKNIFINTNDGIMEVDGESEIVNGYENDNKTIAQGTPTPASAQKAIKKKNKNRMRKDIWKDQTGSSLFAVDNEVRGQVSLVNEGIKVPVSVLPQEAKFVIRQNQFRRKYINDSDDDDIEASDDDIDNKNTLHKFKRTTLGDFIGISNTESDEIPVQKMEPEYLLSPQQSISTVVEYISLLESLQRTDERYESIVNNIKELKTVLIQFVEQTRDDGLLSLLLSSVERINDFENHCIY